MSRRKGFFSWLRDAVNKAARDFGQAIGIVKPKAEEKKPSPIRFLEPVEDEPEEPPPPPLPPADRPPILPHPPPSEARVRDEAAYLEGQTRQHLARFGEGFGGELDADEIDQLVEMRGDRAIRILVLDVTIKYPDKPPRRVRIPIKGPGDELLERVLWYERQGHEVHGFDLYDSRLTHADWVETMGEGEGAKNIYKSDFKHDPDRGLIEKIRDEIGGLDERPPEKPKRPRKRKAKMSSKTKKAARERARRDDKFLKSLEGLTPREQKKRKRERKRRQEAELKGRKKK